MVVSHASFRSVLGIWIARVLRGITPGRAAYVAMPPEVLEELDLSQGPLGQDLLAEDIGDLLDSHALVGLVVDCCARSSEGFVSPGIINILLG